MKLSGVFSSILTVCIVMSITLCYLLYIPSQGSNIRSSNEFFSVTSHLQIHSDTLVRNHSLSALGIKCLPQIVGVSSAEDSEYFTKRKNYGSCQKRYPGEFHIVNNTISSTCKIPSRQNCFGRNFW